MIRRYRRALVATALIFAATPLLAAPADQVRSRIDAFRELGASMKAVNDAQRTAPPQTMLIQISARQIANAARAMPGWFPKGSGPESGAKTKAKPLIWAQPAAFKKAQDAFAAQAFNFQRAANAGNADAIRAETAKLGATCKGCHDQFRAPGN